MPNLDRQIAVAMLHELVENCNIPRDKIAKVAKFFKISRQSVTRIWGRVVCVELPPNFCLNEKLVCLQKCQKIAGAAEFETFRMYRNK